MSKNLLILRLKYVFYLSKNRYKFYIVINLILNLKLIFKILELKILRLKNLKFSF